MDFTKYVSMLEKGALYFCRADLLGDPYEGSLPEKNIVGEREFFVSEVMKEHSIDSQNKVLATMSRHRQNMRKEIYLNCWHMSETESAAMWRLYSSSNESIAIQSNFYRLFNALDSKFYVGIVRYIDYKKDVIQADNSFWPFVYKRKSFEHEHEIRAVHWYPLKEGEQIGDRQTPDGIWHTISLQGIISQVYVSPSSTEWFRELVGRHGEVRPQERNPAVGYERRTNILISQECRTPPETITPPSPSA